MAGGFPNHNHSTGKGITPTARRQLSTQFGRQASTLPAVADFCCLASLPFIESKPEKPQFAQLMLLGFTLAALALPAFGLMTGTIPDLPYNVGTLVSRTRRPKTFWFLFTIYSLMAGALFLCFVGRAAGLIQ